MTTTQTFTNKTTQVTSSSPCPTPLWARAMSHLRAASLDRALASGAVPDASRLLAARSQHLVSRRYRLQLVTYWSDRVRWASTPSTGLNARVPFCRARLLSAQPELRELVTALGATRTPAARGVAMARLLLTDGLGPLYNRHDTTDLGTSLREVTARLG
jgi:hypothetical protein